MQKKLSPSAPTSLTTGSIPKHIRSIALPMSIGFFFNTMYNVVDSFYAGRISTEALAALALCFPVFFILFAVSEGIARGSAALIANAIGAEDAAQESALSAQLFSLGLLCAAILTVIGFAVAQPLFRLMGASGAYLGFATSYIYPLFTGAVFFLLTSLSNSILLARGDSKTFSRVLIIGFFLNLVLNPWFLYGGFGLPAMGIAGIAWATVLIQALGGSYLLFTAISRGYVQVPSWEYARPRLSVYGQILRQGIPTAFNMMSIALGFFVTTYYLQFYGEASVAAFGVGTRIEQIALLPAIGLGTAIISIVGQNNGAGKLQRVRACVRMCVLYGLVLITVASVLLWVFAAPLVGLFTQDPAVINIGTRYVRIMAFIQWAYVMTFIHIGFLQAMKQPMYGFMEAVVRKVMLPMVIFYAIVRVWNLPLESFWWGMAGLNVAMTFITIAYAQWVLRRLSV